MSHKETDLPIKHIYKEWLYTTPGGDSGGNGNFDTISNVLPPGATLISMSTRFLWPYDSWDFKR